MGFLLLQYEFQRANREVNLCNRKTVRINNQLTRATKRIEKMESVFAKEKTANETKWNNISSTFSQQLSMAGMAITQGANNMTDLSQAVGTAVTNFNGLMSGIKIAGICLGSLVSLSPSSITADPNDPNALKSAIMTAINGAIGQAQSVMRQLIEQGKSLDEAALEQRQDAQLQPLSEMEGDIQAEQSLNDTLTTLWEQRRDSAKEKLPQAIENATGHFGLK